MTKINYLSLGGQDEKWKYCGILEINSEIFILNIGISSVINNEYGIQKSIPDLSYLENKKNRIKGIFIGTPRYLNIASLPYLLNMVENIPIYTSYIGSEIIKKLINEFEQKNNKKLNLNLKIINPVNETQVGEVRVTPIKIANSIPSSYGWIFKLNSDENVIFIDEFLYANENLPCLENQLHIAVQQAKNKTSLLISGTQSAGNVSCFAINDAKNFNFLKKSISSTKKRVIVGLFEDDWYSLINLSEIAKIYGMKLYIYDEEFKDLFNKYLTSINKQKYQVAEKLEEDSNSIVIISGNFQSLYSTLDKILNENILKLKAEDMFIMSTITYPETEYEEINIINEICKTDAVVIKQPKTLIPYQGGDEDIKDLVNSINPFNIVTVNAYYKDYINFSKALQNTININRIKFLSIGEKLEIEGKNISVTKVPVAERYVGETEILDINKYVLLERKLITQSGSIIVSIAHKPKQHSLSIKKIELLSIFTNKLIEEEVSELINKNLNSELKKFLTLNATFEIKALKIQTKKIVLNSIEHYLQKPPIILVLITNFF